MDLELSRPDRENRTVATPSIYIYVDVVHRAGIEHHAVDALSRLPTDGADNTPREDKLSVLLIANVKEWMI